MNAGGGIKKQQRPYTRDPRRKEKWQQTDPTEGGRILIKNVNEKMNNNLLKPTSPYE